MMKFNLLFAMTIWSLIWANAALANSDGNSQCPLSLEDQEQEMSLSNFDLRAIEDLNRTHLHALAQPSNSTTTSAPSDEDLEEAASKVSRFLGGVRGEAAVKKIMAKGDKNGDGQGSKSELDAFLKHINLGNFVTRSYWVDGLLDYFGSGRPKVLTEDGVRKMLKLMKLY